MEKRRFYCWLCNCMELSDKERIQLSKVYGSFYDLIRDGQHLYKKVLGRKGEWFESIVWRLAREKQFFSHANQLYDSQLEEGIFFCHREEKLFPERLLPIPDPPLGLFYKGNMREEFGTVAVIGARDCSYYGQAMAKALGKALGQNGITVVSGMARGIDGIAQEAALCAGGTSYGVLGCGVDICYPKSNQRIYNELIRLGAVISTYAPKAPPKPINFPPRNRIVSGLADVVIVVEAGIKSGTLITVDMALEQGKEVWVIPGRMDDRLSVGCNRLISQGAQILWDISEFVEQFMTRIPNGGAKEKEKSLGQGGWNQEKDPIKQQLIKALSHTPVTMEEIWTQWKKPGDIGELQIKLMELVLEGKVLQPSPGHFCRNR